MNTTAVPPGTDCDKVGDKDNVNLISNEYNVNVEPNIKINKPQE